LPVVYDTPWAGAIDALGGLSLVAYARLSRWKRAAALRHPDESTGFQVLARRAPSAVETPTRSAGGLRAPGGLGDHFGAPQSK
jgi:hypothetical protein